MDDRRQLYDRIPCSTQAVDGALRGALVRSAVQSRRELHELCLTSTRHRL